MHINPGIFEALSKTALYFGGLARGACFERKYIEARLFEKGLDDGSTWFCSRSHARGHVTTVMNHGPVSWRKFHHK